MRVRTKLGALVAFAAVMTVLLAVPASAHEQIDPTSFPVGKPAFFTFRTANEEKADLTKVVLTAPKDLPFGTTTQEPAGWTVNTTEAVITWAGGAVKPDAFDQWGFEIEGADQPGTYTYTVTLSFADGKTSNVKVPVTAVAAGASSAAKSSSSAASSSSVGRGKESRQCHAGRRHLGDRARARGHRARRGAAQEDRSRCGVSERRCATGLVKGGDRVGGGREQAVAA